MCSGLIYGKQNGGEGRAVCEPVGFLVFRTFSNAGWLVSSAHCADPLESWTGAVITVYANGFATAILKKSRRAVYSSAEFGQLNSDGTIPIVQEKDQSLIEPLLVFTLESTFTFLLILPNINQRISNIMFTLSERQPSSCPQLYLYSTADKIIPFESVESFIGD
ncbi:hypothetical protein AKJ16_DCAP12827 [Drosera capensis]